MSNQARASQATDAPTIRPEDEKVPIGSALGYGLQHILSMFGGLIAVPIIVGGGAGLSGTQIATLLSATLFVCGLATVLQTVGVPFIGSQLPLVQGVSFAAVSTLLTIVGKDGTTGLRTAYGAVIAAAVIAFLIVPLFAQIVRFFPPVVTGSVMTVIGLSLVPAAGGWIVGQATINGAPNPNFGKVENIALAMATTLIVLALSKFKQTARIAILLGLLLGTGIALVTGQAKFSLNGAAIVAVPQLFAFGTPIFAVGAIVSMLIVMLVIMVETTADLIAVGEVVGTDVDSKRVAAGLRADMLSSAIAPVFGTFPASAFAQNVGLVAMSGIKSRWVVAAGGGLLALFGLSPALAAIVNVIPTCVLGGVGICLFGSVASSGVKTLGKVSFDGNQNALIVAVSLGFGLIPSLVPGFWGHLPGWASTILGSGISACALVSVLLNVWFNVIHPKAPAGLDVAVIAHEPGSGPIVPLSERPDTSK
jgi:xanthine permease